MTRHLVYRPAVRHKLRQLSEQDGRRILNALVRYAEKGEGDLRQLQGFSPPLFRLRIGPWRAILCLEDPDLVLVVSVDNRGEAYRNTR